MAKCPECGKEFPTPQGLSGHRRWKHGGKRPKGGQAYLEAGKAGLVRYAYTCSCGSAFGLVGFDLPRKVGASVEASCPFCRAIYTITRVKGK